MPGNPRPRTVRRVRLGDLADRLAVDAAAGAADVAVTGVTHASQEVRPGDLYAALPGARRHGAEFAAGGGGGRRGGRADRPGRRRAGRRRPGLPVLVVADPRAVLGDGRRRRLRRPDRAA